MSLGQGVRLGGGERGSHQSSPASVGQEFRWDGLCALVTDPRSGVRLSGQALPGGCRAGDEVKVVLGLAQW